MGHFEATVRVFDVIEPDGSAARRTVEQRLRSAGFTRVQVVKVVLQPAITHAVRTARQPFPISSTYAGGGLLVVVSVAWALWFLYLLAG
jgi:hypothetical protein